MVAYLFRKPPVGPFKALLGALLVVGLLGYGTFWGINKMVEGGRVEGLTTYHNMCYNSGGGFVIVDGKAVMCAPLGVVPELPAEDGGKLPFAEKSKKALDKAKKM